MRRAREASFSVRLTRKSLCALSLSRGLLLLTGDAGGGPLPLTLGPPAQLGPLGFVGLVGLGGVRPLGLALGLIAGPAAAVGAPAAGVLVQLQHVGHRALQEGPVVRHDHHATAATGDHLFQSGQAVEVEVVGRLVQEGDVEAGKEDGGQRGARLLAAREGRHGLGGHGLGEADLFEGRDEAGLEVAGRDGLETGESRDVTVVGLVLTASECGRGVRQLVLRGGDAGTAVQRGADALGAVGCVLLVQVADRGGGRIHADVAGARLQETGQDLQERRLADAVGPDDPEAGGGPDGQRHVVEHGAATAFVADVAGHQGGRRRSGQGRHEGTPGRGRSGAGRSWGAVRLRTRRALPHGAIVSPGCGRCGEVQ